VLGDDHGAAREKTSNLTSSSWHSFKSSSGFPHVIAVRCARSMQRAMHLFGEADEKLIPGLRLRGIDRMDG
jgi:hypothetical protein